MAETIVQCDGCGAHGRRAETAAAPDFWFYIAATDRTFSKSGGLFIIWACSEACRDSMWRKGPALGAIDDVGTFRIRDKKAKADRG